MNRVSWKQTKKEWRNGNWKKKKAQSGAWDDREIRKQIKYGEKKKQTEVFTVKEKKRRGAMNENWDKIETETLCGKMKPNNNKNSIILRKKRESL